MPRTTPVNGDTELTSAFWNPNVRDQVVSQFSTEAGYTASNASAAFPAGAPVALTLNTAGEGLYMRTSAATLRPPWNLPWGVIAVAGITTSQTGIGTALTDVAGVTVSWVAVANRWYRATYSVRLDSNHGAVNGGQAAIIDGGGNVTARALVSLAPNPGPGDQATASGFWIGTRSAGANSFKLAVAFTAGAGNSTFADANEGTFLTIEDIGPSGAPS